jgi:hypothetical protein
MGVERDRPSRAGNVELSEHDGRRSLELQQLGVDLPVAQGPRDQLRILADVRCVRCVVRDREEPRKFTDDGGFVLLPIRADGVADLGCRRPGHCLPGKR